MPSPQQAPNHLPQALPSHEDHIGPALQRSSTGTSTGRHNNIANKSHQIPKRAYTTDTATISDHAATSTHPSRFPFKSRATSLTIIEPVTFSPRPSARSSPLISRTPSLAISERRPRSGSSSTSNYQHQRPRTGSSTTSTAILSLHNPNGDNALTPQTSPEETADDDDVITTNPGWTPALADRLTFVQRQKWESQKRWSAGQEAWAKEEDELMEMRQKHLKALKRANVHHHSRAVSEGAGWRRKMSLGRSWPRRGSAKSNAVSEDSDGASVVSDSSGPEDTDVHPNRAMSGTAVAATGGSPKSPSFQSPPRHRVGLKGLFRRMSGAKGFGDD